MSASSKKKLRKEKEAVQMTEKQLAAQKEAKKLNLYTGIFVAVVALFLVIAIVVGVTQAISNSGIREKNTIAATVGEHEISNAELSYFYIDTINNFYSQYGSYASLFGLDVTTALDQQISDESTGETWADYFINSAVESARSIYALNDAANAAGYTMSEEEAATIDSNIATMQMYAMLYGYEDVDTYLKAMYGKGASEKSYRSYMEMSVLADSYYTAYGESLTYDDAALRAAEAENYNAYSSFTYNYYYLATSKFLEGGTTDEEGNTTYSDEEKAASVAAAEEAANSLIGEEITTVEELDAAIAALSINAETTAASTLCEDYAYGSVSSTIQEWVTASNRSEGDKTVIASTSTSTDEDGNETTTTTGYYVVYFVGSNDNNYAMKNVRHILVAFEGGITDDDGNTTYSDEEKAAAKTAAEEILNEWKSGDATEDSFAALANEKSDDGDGTTGGLYENIVPSSNYVENFLNWALNATTPGETGIVETEYGYHVMYFVGDSELSYRDYQIDSELRSAELSDWYNGLYEAMTVTAGNTNYMLKSIVLSSN